MTSTATPSRLDVLRGLARNSAGMSNMDAAAGLGLGLTAAARAVAYYVSRGSLFKVREGKRVRYFGTQEAADRWACRPSESTRTPWSLHLSGTPHLRRFAQPGAAPAARQPAAEDLEEQRREAARRSREYGAGFLAAGVGFDVLTGKPWAPRK